MSTSRCMDIGGQQGLTLDRELWMPTSRRGIVQPTKEVLKSNIGRADVVTVVVTIVMYDLLVFIGLL
ncbi:uncharacterized protein BDV14DRAFT_186392 [Aspergillus stella-maris]|uniref:uncharacterized protein n=1 Tax=Aspergillus stella-maris TaxID=1810926 RepID=UPI003CCE0EFB